MNKQKRLRRNVLVLFLTLLMMGAVTLAWFINWMTPFTDAFRFASPSLKVNVTITDQDGNPLPSQDGNAIMRAESLKPGDELIYLVSVENGGGACRIYLGLSGVKNFEKDDLTGAYTALSADSDKDCLSDALRLSVWQKEEGNAQFTEKDHKFLGRDQEFFFNESFLLEADDTLSLQYRVKFAGVGEGGEALTGSGAAAGNSFTLLKTEGFFTVSATLAR